MSIDLTTLLATPATPDRSTRTSTPSLPSLSIPSLDTLPSLVALPTRSIARVSFDAMQNDTLVLNDTTSAHFVYPVNASRYVTRLTSTLPVRPNASLALDSTPVTSPLFNVALPKRDPSDPLSSAHVSAPSTARLTAVLLHMTRNLTSTRSLDIAIDSRRVDLDRLNMICPNTNNPVCVIIAYAIAVRPSRDVMCLSLITALCDALSLDTPLLDSDDVPVFTPLTLAP